MLVDDFVFGYNSKVENIVNHDEWTMYRVLMYILFFKDTATTEISTSLFVGSV